MASRPPYSILHAIGNTPLIALQRLPTKGSARLLAKLESVNPGGSIKDRIVLAMVEDAEDKGLLVPGMTIVESTSGNTGISMVLIGMAKGYPVTIVMPEDVQHERSHFLTRLGAKVVFTSFLLGMEGAHQRAHEMVQEDKNLLLLDQFSNPANPRTHRENTANEILNDITGSIDAFVTGVGTGGTITGVGEALKEHNSSILVVAVEPASSPVISGGKPHLHEIPGIGPSFVPPILNRTMIDEIIQVTNEQAKHMTSQLATEEGLLVGPSSGANVFASLKVGHILGPLKTVVTILPDTGNRY
jgi:cysteine synthase A